MHALGILLVDDNQSIGRTIATALERLGHSVTYVTDGIDAENEIAKSAFDVVLMDIIVPGRDGFELLGLLRSNHPDTRVIAMSGDGKRSRQHYLDTASGLGAHGVLGKPFSLSDLLTELRAVMSRSAN